MIRKSNRISSLLGLFSALLILGTANHCVFEDVFVSLGKIVLGLEAPHHLPNHLGATSEHKHQDSSESHQHGQPHPLIVLNSGTTATHQDLFLTVLLPIAFISAFSLCLGLRSRLVNLKPVPQTGDPPGYVKFALTSLTSAPQAPPQAVYPL